MITKLWKVAVRLGRSGINRLWVLPLENHMIPRLSEGEPGRFRGWLLRKALWCAAAGRLIIEELQVNVRSWTGPDWSVTYIGNGFLAEALRQILFPAPPEERLSPPVFLWQVPELVRKSIREGDLVVCELNKVFYLAPRDDWLTFTTPQWVKQILNGIDRPLDEILMGMSRTARRQIRKLETNDFTYSLSHEQSDFDLFYYRMYLPYIQARHTGRSAIIYTHDYLQDLLRKGDLLIVKQGQDPVCGALVYTMANTYIAAICGVIDGQMELVKQGANIALYWFVLNQARQQRSQFVDFGASFPLTSNGIFEFKRYWGPRVVSWKEVYTQWSFLSKEPSPDLLNYLNGRGFIAEEAGKHYRIILLRSGQELDEAEQARELDLAVKNGLSGIVLIFTGGKRQFIPLQTDREGSELLKSTQGFYPN